jgi:hypothetical protein
MRFKAGFLELERSLVADVFFGVRLGLYFRFQSLEFFGVTFEKDLDAPGDCRSFSR